ILFPLRLKICHRSLPKIFLYRTTESTLCRRFIVMYKKTESARFLLPRTPCSGVFHLYLPLLVDCNGVSVTCIRSFRAGRIGAGSVRLALSCALAAGSLRVLSRSGIAQSADVRRTCNILLGP